MASSSLPLSLLAKGIGQVVTNGHEKLEVYLEPEDYYNLKSYSPYHLPTTLEHQEASLPDYDSRHSRPIPLHKTFVTRKGALLIFSEELANKAIAEQARRLSLHHHRDAKHDEKHLEVHEWEDESEAASEMVASEKGPDSLRTVQDLSVAILTYGNRPDYRKRGDDLYLRFIHESRAPRQERKIRPGFSPKRYIASWSKYWDEGMLQKLRTSGLVQDKTLFRQNPLLPHLYQPATYNMSAVPPPYRVTRNMLLAPGNVGTYEFQRPKYDGPPPQDVYSIRAGPGAARKPRRDPPPSHQDINEELLLEEDEDPIPIGSIQAVKFLESGEIQEVKYSELKPQEKQEILAELLATAWEHGKHIEETLELVLASNKPRAQSGASSSAASELMVDMHRAILSLVESPVRKQIQERQRLLQLEEEKKKKKQEEEEAKKERRRLRKQQKAEKEAQKLAKQKRLQEEEEQRAREKKRHAEERAKKLEEMKHAKEEEHKEEERKKEEKRKARREEKERKRQERHDARKKKEEQTKAAAEDEEKRRQLEAEREAEIKRQQHEEEEAAREERRRLRREKREKRHQEKEAAAAEQERLKEEERAQRRHRPHKEVHNIPGVETTAYVEQETTAEQVQPGPKEGKPMYIGPEGPSQRVVPPSAPMPAVPNNTPATEQRKVRVQRQIPMQAVIAEARSKDGYAASGSVASSRSSVKVAPIPPGTLIAAGDGEYARVTLAEPLPPPAGKQPKRKSIPVQPRTTLSPRPSQKSHPSSHSSGPKNITFPAELPGDSESGSNKRSSFYGGAMPITSNIVKQTLSDKISMLSASQENSLAGSGKKGSVPESSQYRQQAPEPAYSDYDEDEYDVPVIGVEPPTPMQHNLFATPVAKAPSHALQQIIPDENYLSPAASESTRSKKSRKSSKKSSSIQYSDEEEEKLSAPSHLTSKKDQSQPAEELSQSETKSSKSKSDTILSSEKSSPSASKWLKVSDSAHLPGIDVDVTYQSLKGSKGPGSQSSAASISKTGSKKSSSYHRGSVPSALLEKNQAAVFMPGGEIVEVGRKVDQLPTTDESTAEESTDESEKPSSPPPVSKKTSLKSGSIVSSEKSQSRRVSFKEEKPESSSEVEDETTSEEGEAEDAQWPEAGDDKSGSRPISSRSEKLTDHAQKVAKLVVASQRPGSRLEEDAMEAAKVWNAVAAKEDQDEDDAEDEEESETEEETEEEETVDEDGAFKAAAQEQENQENLEKEKRAKEERERKEKLKKEAEEKKKAAQKEIKARVVAKKPPPSVKSIKSTSSVKSSVSSVQEVFVSEVKRKASELGISEKKLVFEADVVDKVSRSTIDPDEVEVFHDKEAGQHVVRSRHSSVTTTSYQTSVSESTEAKKKLVIDMPLQEKPQPSASPRRSVSSVTTTTASPTSPTRLQAMSRSSSISGERRKSSIPVDAAGVSLEYEVTSYEGKLGDPKPEEPLILSGRPKVEPEKLKTVEKEAEQAKKKSKEKADDKKAAKADKKLKDDAAAKKDASKKAPSIGEESTISEDEKLKRDLARITEGQKSFGKKGGKKGKGKKGEKQQEASPPQVPSPEKLPTKTPETPFLAGQPKEKIVPEDQKSSPSSISSKMTTKDAKKAKGGKPTTKEPKTQVELEDKLSKPQKKGKKKPGKDEEEPVTKDSTRPAPEQESPVPAETPRAAETETEDEDLDQLPPIPSATPDDDYAFIRVEETPEPTPPPEPLVEEKPDDEKSQASEVTATEDGTEKTDGTDVADQKSAEDEAEREAKLASKKEREAKRAAAAEKRRLEVEKKRKEKEEQLRKEKEEQERQDQLKEEFEAERRRRTEELQRKREEAEREREREKQEEELRKKREEQRKERERRQQEEHKRKMEEIQRKKKEDEERKAEAARIQAEEDERLRKEEEEMMAQMAEEERIEYERAKAEEAEQKRKEAEERRIREEEEARIAMEQARIQALIKAKQQAALEEKLKFVREFFIEANGMDQTQNVNRSFTFSYFELLQMLGLEFTTENAEL